ncbi:hypothetical protein NE235_29815 [Actinoallomurus spadix]|nr:hypothetical protein [Actinoallomurus spadix]MCO5990318.1 hypothetical protein [Actinoallomurus spadix]
MADSDEVDGDPSGIGEAAHGRVCARVGSDGLLERLDLDPRLLRLRSEELAGHIVSAVRAAQNDRLARGEDPPAPAPAPLDPETLVRRLDEMEAQADRGYARLTATLDEMLRRLDGG